MPRVVCQVRARPGQVSFVWSEGKLSFEPYHLAGREAAEFLELAQQARAALGRLPGDGHGLAEIGHGLDELLFHQGDGPAGQVRRWLASLEVVDSLEVLGDHGLVPWNVLYGASPAGQDFGLGAAGWQPFWGNRYNLATGRRAGALRQVRLLEAPAVLLAVDPVLRDSLPESQQKRLRDLAEANQLPCVEAVADFTRALREQPPDVLYLFCRSDGESLLFGDRHLTPADLEDLLRNEAGGDIPWNSRLLFVNACGAAAADHAALTEQLRALGLGGLIYPEGAAPADFACSFGLDFLASFLYQNEPVGPLLQKLRGRSGPLGLLYHASSPPGLRVTWQEGQEQLAGDEEAEEEAAEALPLPARPYRPLRPFDREDRALLVGREKETTLVADLVDAPASRMVVVHGRSGVGKSSLLRAVVLPYLEEAAVGYRALRDRSEEDVEDEAAFAVTAIRTTSDLPGQLALALSAFCARPYRFTTPAGDEVAVDLPALLRQAVGGGQASSTAIQEGAAPAGSGQAPPPLPVVAEDALRAALVGDSGLLGRLLTTLGDRLPFEPVVLIEQGEEMFTLARQREDAENRAAGLEMLRRVVATPGLGKLLVSLRTEYFGRVVGPLGRGAVEGGLRSFFLLDLDEPAMLAAARQPTLAEPVPYSSEVPLQKYGFTFDEGVAEVIVREVRKAARSLQEPALTLLQAVCARLANQALSRADHVVREADRKSVGAIDAGLAGYLDSLIATVVAIPRDRPRLRALLHDLCIAQPDGTVTRDLVPEDRLAEHWHGRTALEALLEQGAEDEVRLFELYWLGPAGQENRHVSLGHDALAPVVARGEREEVVRRSHGRKVMVDWLWVVIPLTILLVVLGAYWWSAYRVRLPAAAAELEQVQEDKNKALAEQRLYQVSVDALRWPLYVNHLAQAEIAWGEGDVLHLRQLLLNHRESPRTAEDLRGFEWYHLWLLADRSRATLFGHPGRTSAVVMTPDGKLLASAGADGTIRLWSEKEGQSVLHSGRAAPVNALALSADGSRLASGSADGTVMAWQLGKPGEPRTFKAGPSPIRTVAFMALKTVAFGGKDGTVRSWEIGAKEATTLFKQPHPILALAYSAPRLLLGAAAEDGTIGLWDTAAGKKLKDLPAQPGRIHALAFSTDGKTLVAGGGGPAGKGLVKFFDMDDPQKEKQTLTPPAPVLTLALSGDAKTLASGGQENAIRLWDVPSGKEKDVFRGHLGWVSAVALAADGTTLASGSFDSTVKLWSPEAPGARQVLAGLEGGAAGVAVSPDNRLVASGDDKGAVTIWEAGTGRVLRTLKGKHGPVASVVFARREKKLLLASGHRAEGKEPGAILVWDVDKGDILHTLKGHAGGVSCLAADAGGQVLASGGADKTVRLWELASGKLQHELPGPQEILAVALSPSGQLLAAGDVAGTIRAWPTTTFKETVFKDRHQGAVNALAFSPDEKELASAGNDQTVKRWDPATGEAFVALRGHVGPVLAVAYSSTGEVIVSGGSDRTARLWDAPRAQLRFTFTGHGAAVRGVAFAPDRRLLATASADGAVRLWRAAPEDAVPVHEAAPAGD
jgi:WD40 repeat protein